MKEGTATYDPKTDRNIMIAAGLFKAHVWKFEVSNLKTRGGPRTVFNITYRVSEEAAKVNVRYYKASTDGRAEAIMVPERDSDGVEIYNDDGEVKMTHDNGFAEYMVGKKVRDNGIWFNPSPESGKGWQNNEYRELLEVFNVEIPEKDGIQTLGEMEEDDILHKPCIIRIGPSSYVPDKTNPSDKRWTMRVLDVLRWENGKKLDSKLIEAEGVKKEEEAPF